MIVTPVAKHPIALRNSAEFKLIVDSMLLFVCEAGPVGSRSHTNRYITMARCIIRWKWPSPPSRRP